MHVCTCFKDLSIYSEPIRVEKKIVKWENTLKYFFKQNEL